MMIKLIPDAAIAWRFASVQAALVLTILTAVQADLVPMLQPLMEQDTYLKVSALLSFLVIVLRVVAQPGLEPERQLLALDKAEHATLPTDQVEVWAMYLYAASQPSKPWEQVSAESKAKWRQVASAARGYAVDSTEAP
jgi:hypothetical protein